MRNILVKLNVSKNRGCFIRDWDGKSWDQVGIPYIINQFFQLQVILQFIKTRFSILIKSHRENQSKGKYIKEEKENSQKLAKYTNMFLYNETKQKIM